MKLGLKTALIVLCGVTLAAPTFAGTFVNGGFENGGLGGSVGGIAWSNRFRQLHT
jgi:hypothetical protein